jgi:hypothetical protein
MGGPCGTYGEEEDKYEQVFGGKPEGKRPTGRPVYRWDDNIRMGLDVE